ncbi:hypothetical protein DYB32_003475 [Aphanomyces invadans]|uniref:RING-type domain-containing protein n=1 Tax=Aphanomyces invadans TaxID=157072 RepID=A0A418B0G8_9STRA|nr:hypothetical protein DYB32_003475 [Aphanomyces invadans]
MSYFFPMNPTFSNVAIAATPVSPTIQLHRDNEVFDHDERATLLRNINADVDYEATEPGVPQHSFHVGMSASLPSPIRAVGADAPADTTPEPPVADDSVAMKDKASTSALSGIFLVSAVDAFALSALNGDLTPLHTLCKAIYFGVGQSKKVGACILAAVTLHVEYGTYVSSTDLAEMCTPDCSICYDTMQTPVQLQCAHLFCEECIAEWFDRERSCPLCRADVHASDASSPATKPMYLDGSTSPFPQFL